MLDDTAGRPRWNLDA